MVFFVVLRAEPKALHILRRQELCDRSSPKPPTDADISRHSAVRVLSVSTSGTC